MNTKLLVGLFLVGLILLSGCASETPRGDISAPTNNSTGSSTGDAPANVAPVKDTYEIGEKATAKNGMEFQLTRVARIANCGDEGYCFGAYVKVTNKGEDKESAIFSSSVLLDDKGRQYEYGSFTLFTSCPNKFDQTTLFPGAAREGFLCFDGLKDDVTQIKAIIDLGFIGSTKFVYLVDPSKIETLDPKGEIEITSVDASFTSSAYGGYGSISGVKYALKNTGETYLSDLTYDYTIKKKTLLIDSGKNKSLPLYSLEPGKTDEGSLGVFKTLDQGGEYTIDVTINGKNGELAKVTKTFVTD